MSAPAPAPRARRRRGRHFHLRALRRRAKHLRERATARDGAAANFDRSEVAAIEWALGRDGTAHDYGHRLTQLVRIASQLRAAATEDNDWTEAFDRLHDEIGRRAP